MQQLENKSKLNHKYIYLFSTATWRRNSPKLPIVPAQRPTLHHEMTRRLAMSHDMSLAMSNTIGGGNSKNSTNKWSKTSPIDSNAQHIITMAMKANINELYEASVQTPHKEVMNLLTIHRTVHQNQCRYVVPIYLREDFCGTALLCKAWLDKNVQHRAIGIDWDNSVLEYAKNMHLPHFGETADDSRIQLYCANVLDHNSAYDAVDVLAALNYSICYFHTRASLVEYLSAIVQRKYLRSGGVFICDLFGGAEYYNPNRQAIQTTRHISNFKYIFEQKDLNLLTNRIRCSMHFKFQDGSMMKNAFQYDFRLWTLCELREIFVDSGFDRIHVWIIHRNRHHDSRSESRESTIECDATTSDCSEETGVDLSDLKCIQLYPIDCSNACNDKISMESLYDKLFRSWNAYIVGSLNAQ